MRTGKINTTGERGVALIMVLGMIAVLTLLATHLMATSQVTAREAKVLTTRQHLAYVAESATSRALWMLLADRKLHLNDHRNLLSPPGSREGQETGGVWRADGRVHELVQGEDMALVMIRDADNGLDVSGNNPAGTLRELVVSDEEDDPDRQQRVERFLDVLRDYVDGNDLRQLHGKERDDYRAEGYYHMPRNEPLQFREEILWVENAAVVLPLASTGQGLDAIRVVPPVGQRYPNSKGPAFLSSSPGLIQKKLGLGDEELKAVLEARAQYLREEVSLADLLSPELYSRVLSLFSVSESGIASFVATATDAGGQIRRTLRMTQDSREPALRTRIGVHPVIRNWERVVE